MAIEPSFFELLDPRGVVTSLMNGGAAEQEALEFGNRSHHRSQKVGLCLARFPEEDPGADMFVDSLGERKHLLPIIRLASPGIRRGASGGQRRRMDYVAASWS